MIINNSKMTLNKVKLDHDILVSKRQPLLEAWDTMVANVSFGTKSITESRKKELLKWHQDILHLKESAFENVPQEVKYYIKKENNYEN